jgi:tripartite-type tricarboxylate transporter receptor subunit TctC
VAANKALKDPDVLKQLETQGLNPLGGSPDDFAAFIKNEMQRWARVMHDIDANKMRKEEPAKP